jgi:predicted transcriptional regulator of viral defense system
MTKNPLLQYGNIPITSNLLAACYGDLKESKKKVQALEKAGELIRLRRGLYVVNPELSGKPINVQLCANHIYGPSYVSLHWALRWYGLIPERVFRMTSVTIQPSKVFENTLGIFDYYKVNREYFPIGVRSISDEDISYLMATPEKALCDLILYDSYLPSRSVKGLMRYLEEDIRFDMDELAHFDVEIIRECAEKGNKKLILNNLIKTIKQ